jgi:hypothetical protein
MSGMQRREAIAILSRGRLPPAQIIADERAASNVPPPAKPTE